jgi:hypothetical protein
MSCACMCMYVKVLEGDIIKNEDIQKTITCTINNANSYLTLIFTTQEQYYLPKWLVIPVIICWTDLHIHHCSIILLSHAYY